MRVLTHCSVWLLASLCLLSGTPAQADDPVTLVIKEHRFVPAELVVPAGKKIILLVNNQDSTPEEFESHSLNREKIIPGNTQIKLFIGPLQPGNYDFVGEFHQDTARGRIIAK